MEFPLPHNIAVLIAGWVAATSPQPMDDLSSLRATCKAMHVACRDRAVGRRVALEQESIWKFNWSYDRLVEHLAIVSNPHACYVTGFDLVFLHGRAQTGTQFLAREAVKGHMVAAYVLAMLYYDADRRARDAFEYIRQVEGEAHVGYNAAGSIAMKWTNKECCWCRHEAMNIIDGVAWRFLGRPRSEALPVAVPNIDDDAWGCSIGGNQGTARCGRPTWEEWRVFCTENCRIKHEHDLFCHPALYSMGYIPSTPVWMHP